METCNICGDHAVLLDVSIGEYIHRDACINCVERLTELLNDLEKNLCALQS